MVRIAVIGAGFMGQTHITAYKGMQNAQVVAVCDVNAPQGKALAQDANCPWYGNCDAMLQTEQIDVVDICLPTFLHEEYVLKAANHKKHIFCEKPVTLSLASLENMLSAVRSAGVQFAVGQAVRYWPEYVRAKQLYDSGALGEMKYARATRMSVHPKWSEWYRRPENSGGGLFDLHLHDVDYLCFLFGRVKSVYAVGKKNALGCWNHVASTLNFENGISALAEGVIEMPEGFPFTMELKLVGSQKAFCYQMDAGDNLEDVDSARRTSTLYGAQPASQKLDIVLYDAYHVELQDFVNHIDDGTPITVITPESVEHVLKVIFAIRTSLETGKVTEIQP